MKLTRNEGLYLADIISIHADPPPGVFVGTDRPPYPEMVLKIMGTVVFHADNPTCDAEVDFDMEELMLIYEHSHVPAALGTENVGMNLVVKASREILNLNKTVVDEQVWIFEGDLNDNAEANTSEASNRTADPAGA